MHGVVVSNLARRITPGEQIVEQTDRPVPVCSNSSLEPCSSQGREDVDGSTPFKRNTLEFEPRRLFFRHIRIYQERLEELVDLGDEEREVRYAGDCQLGGGISKRTKRSGMGEYVRNMDLRHRKHGSRRNRGLS